MEPAMPRRKKHPELAYRTHEFLAYEEDGSNDSGDVFIRTDRARVYTIPYRHNSISQVPNFFYTLYTYLPDTSYTITLLHKHSSLEYQHNCKYLLT